jgi:hypothetical protein
VGQLILTSATIHVNEINTLHLEGGQLILAYANMRVNDKTHYIYTGAN